MKREIDWDGWALSLLVFTALSVVEDVAGAIRQNTAARKEANAMMAAATDAARTLQTPKE